MLVTASYQPPDGCHPSTSHQKRVLCDKGGVPALVGKPAALTHTVTHIKVCLAKPAS